MSVWFIIGASRGFGLEITRRAPHRGDQVAATARHPGAITEAIPDAGNALLTLPIDVTNASQAAAAVSTAIARFGRIDVLVNDAGRGLLGAVEEVSDAEARAGNVPERLFEMVLRPRRGRSAADAWGNRGARSPSAPPAGPVGQRSFWSADDEIAGAQPAS